MKRKLQFAGWLMALAMSAAAAVPSFAQGPRVNLAQNRQDNKPPKQQSQAPRQSPPREQPRRQEQRQEQRREPQQQQETRRAQNERQNSGAERPPNSNTNRGETATRPSFNSNRPPSAYTPPFRKEFNNLSPQEMQKVAQVWNQLRPEQREHIRNDVLPKWQQMPPDRRRAIQQRLGVLKNMPESARNQHLNDPNFTRGMSEEDKATLRDLSHLHVGGAPEPPNE